MQDGLGFKLGKLYKQQGKKKKSWKLLSTEKFFHTEERNTCMMRLSNSIFSHILMMFLEV